MKTNKIVSTMTALFLVSMFVLTFAPTVKAHTEADPYVTDLIAGQNIDVGEVYVWNDAEHLYVRYETANYWTLGETHIHVATSLGEIPQVNGNPIPGLFEYSMEHYPPVTEYTYAIDLNGWGPSTDLYIAAHADVCGPGAEGLIPAQGVLTVVPLYTWISPPWDPVGTVTASIVGDNLIVDFDITFAGWVMHGTHIYVDLLPPPIYPPPYSEFPYKHEGLANVTTDSHTISLASLGAGCNDVLYISAHASVWYPPPPNVYRDAWSELDPSNGWEKYFSITIPCMYV